MKKRSLKSGVGVVISISQEGCEDIGLNPLRPTKFQNGLIV